MGDRFVLDVPAGALSSAARVSVAEVAEPADLPLAASVGPAYDVDVGGASLRAPATVTVSVRGSALPAGAALADVFLARYDAPSASWDALPSKVDPTAGTVSAAVDHLSRVQVFAAKVKEAAAALLDLYTKGLQVVGIRTAPPTCTSPPPAGVTFTLVPKSLANAGPTTIPGGNFVHLVLGCPDAVAGDQVKVKIANNRSYAQLLAPQQGLQVSVDRVDHGSVSETLAAAIASLFKPTGVYLPANGEADLTLTVPAGATRSLEVATSQLTLVIDGGLRLIDVFVPEAKKADAAKCLYANASSNGPVPSLREAAKIAKDCAAPLVTGMGKVLLGPVALYIDNEMQRLANQIDSSANAVLGGGESVQVTLPAPVTRQPLLTVQEIAQRFWEAAVLGDRARAVQFGTSDAYDLLQQNLNIPGARGFQFRACNPIEPATTYRGIFYTRGADLCQFGSPQDQFARLSLVLVPTDGDRSEVRIVLG